MKGKRVMPGTGEGLAERLTGAWEELKANLPRRWGNRRGETRRSSTETAQTTGDAGAASAEGPTLDQLKAELRREYYGVRYRQTLRGTIYTLVVAAAAAVLVAVLVMPVLQIYGSSMNPTLEEGDIVISIKGTKFEQGDLVAFYYGSKILVKRYIAGPGQWVDIDADGNVYVDGELLDEPYLAEKALGETDLDMPYQVPDGKIFVMGDHRSTSIDSRSSAVGCISDEQIIGKIVFRAWPLAGFGTLE